MQMDASPFTHIDENFFEQAIIERLCLKMGYKHLFGPDVQRTGDGYRDVFLHRVLHDSLNRINFLPEEAIQEAILKITNVEGGSLAQRNEAFNDYLQSGVEVRYFDGRGGAERHSPPDRLRRPRQQLLPHSQPVDRLRALQEEARPGRVRERHTPGRVRAQEPLPGGHRRLGRLPPAPQLHEARSLDVRAQRLLRHERHGPDARGNHNRRRGPLRQLEVGRRRLLRDQGGRLDDHARRHDAQGQAPRHREELRLLQRPLRRAREVLAAYHQYFGVRKAVARAEEAVGGDGKIGVFWHTQGSGKSLSMVFFAHLLQAHLDSPTVVVIHRPQRPRRPAIWPVLPLLGVPAADPCPSRQPTGPQGQARRTRGQRHHFHHHAEVHRRRRAAVRP